MIKQLEPFHSAVNNPGDVAQSAREHHRPVIGYLCSYAPEELIYAAGAHPMRLSPSRSTCDLSLNHLQAYCCSLAKGILDQALAGDLDYLDGTVFPHTCDTIQRLSDIWRLNISKPFFADITLPVKLTTQSAMEYMHAVFSTFVSELSAFTGKKVTTETLEASITLFNRIHASLNRIYLMASQTPGIITGQDLLTVTKAAMIMDRVALDKCLTDLANALESGPAKAGPIKVNPAKRLILSGSFCDTPEIFSLIEKAEGIVVSDDLCSGMRWFNGQIDTDIPPMEALVQRYTHRIVCPAKHSGTKARAKALIDLVKSANAQGVIFTILKFCDPHAFDYPYLKSALDQEKIPSLFLELDAEKSTTGGLATRIETFIQMI